MPEPSTTFIGVDSYIELYTTIFGWYQYNNLWDILTETGLVFLPFFGLVINTFLETFPSQQEGNASFTALKQLEFNLILMFTVIVLAGQPLMNLNISELRFVNLCVESGDQFNDVGYTVANDQSVYKRLAATGLGAIKDKSVRNTLGEYTQTRVPVWWYGVMAISGGVTLAAKKGVPCKKDIRMTLAGINSLRIEDPEFRQEIHDFIRLCYRPTLTDFEKYKLYFTNPKNEYGQRYKEITTDVVTNQYKGLFSSLEVIPTSHHYWIGSSLFLEMPGPYFYRGRTVPERKIVTKTGSFIIPNCHDWWLGTKEESIGYELKGIRPQLKKILDSVNLDKSAFINASVLKVQSYYSVVLMQIANKFSIPNLISPYQIDDIIFANWIAIQLDLGQYGLYKTINTENSFELRSVIRGIGGLLGSLGMAMEKWPLVDIVRAAAPIVLAFILMSLYFLLPIALVFSGYSLSFLLFGTVAIFSFKFMSYFWHVAWWIEQNLLEVIGVSSGYAIAGLLVPMTVATIYFMVPVLFLSMLAWANFHLGQELESALDEMGGGNSYLAEASRTGVEMIRAGIEFIANLIAAFTGGLTKFIANAVKVIIRATR